MNIIVQLALILVYLLLTACSPVKSTVSNQYRLDTYSVSASSGRFTNKSMLISPPEAVAGYRTEQMLYTIKPFEIAAFANNAWNNPPADMLLPLITQSLQRAGFFYVVTSTTNSESTDYRLDTQIIELHQNFLTNPSHIDFVIKATVSNINKNRPVASRVFSYHPLCPSNTPYGGVIAANQAVKHFTADLSNFVIQEVKQHSGH